MLPTQLSGRQPALGGQGRQAPEPLQVPSFEQSPALTSLFGQRDLGSGPPLSTLEHVPPRLVPVPRQVLHSPPEAASAQAELQHTPSVQNPLWHWLAVVHATPLTFNPQELFTQVSGATQSVSLVHVVLQAPESHTKPPHDWLAGVVQAPLPSQVETGVTEEVPAQTAALQLKPLS